MVDAGFAAARAIAPTLHAHFTDHLSRATHLSAADARRLAPPHVSDIEALVDAAFWASLRREEGHSPKISLALVNPDTADAPMVFGTALPVTPASLVKVAPAVERPGIHLGVSRHGSHDASRLEVWGTTRSIPPYAFVLEVAGPGLLVIKHKRGEAGKYVNVAVIEGDQIKVIDDRASYMPECPAMLGLLLGAAVPEGVSLSADVLIALAVSMRAHGRGGIMLMVPERSRAWEESVIHPMPYLVTPPHTILADLLRRTDAERRTRTWQEELEDAVSTVAGLTAVDGATVINDRGELLTFGAKISRRRGQPVPDAITATEPVEGNQPQTLTPTQLGGTRHLSAAQFVHDQRDALALVASQDGRFTVFAWSHHSARVHAHRVEALLL